MDLISPVDLTIDSKMEPKDSKLLSDVFDYLQGKKYIKENPIGSRKYKFVCFSYKYE
jgi:hypothetical protein